ncbi:MAG: hypothetical protein KC549_09560 [Myxococcales bacterium]|nr:hypothetical protein [Myxococcales bacterium]MCB9546670.1 hypothetical protein [Myxococcales bacterium]
MNAAQGTELITQHELFGVRRPLAFGGLERHEIRAGDGATLTLHHVPGGGPRGPVILAPGTAMSALSFCLDTVDQNLAEYLHAEGFDVWLFDWRTSPELAVSRQPYTLADVAAYDWPVAIAEVRARTGVDQVGVIAHCLSSSALHLSLARRHTDAAHIKHLVASQVALHLVFNWVGRIKRWTFADKLIPIEQMLHFRPAQITRRIGDLILTLLAPILPKSYRSKDKVLHRHSACFGDLLHVERVSPATIALMAPLIPQVVMGFCRSAMAAARAGNSLALTRAELASLDGLKLPITYVVGEHNNMFVPEATRRTFELVCEKNGPEQYRREIIKGYGHLDCMVGSTSNQDVFPLFAQALDPR